MIVLILILTVINWFIYHKFVRVVYFDLGKGLVKEFISCFLVAAIEAALIIYAGEWVLDFVLSFLVVGFKLVLWVVGIIVSILLLWWIYRLIKKPQKSDAEDKTEVSGTVESGDSDNQTPKSTNAEKDEPEEDKTENTGTV